MGKVVSRKEIARVVSSLRKKGKRIITTNGVFDILHIGHITYLQKARKLGDVLIVGINTDASVRKLKGPKRPINNQKSRAICLAALECVDYVVIFPEDTPNELLLVIKPAIHVKGGDYRGQEEHMVERPIVEKNGGKIVLIDMVKGFSTTGLIDKIVDVYGKKKKG